jgi:transposase
LIFIGNDWSESHHDVEVQDERGQVLVRRRLEEGVAGVTALHELLGELADDPAEVVIGIETDRGLWVSALLGAGYEIYAVNPKAVARYRERYGGGSGKKSDTGDAHVLCDLVRLDRHNHRPVAGDSEGAEAIKVLARAHQRLIWARRRQLNALRAMLREYYPAALLAFGEDLGHHDALVVLEAAPTPAKGAALTRGRLSALLRRGGRQRYVDRRAGEIHEALRSRQLFPPDTLAAAYGAAVVSATKVIGEMNRQLAASRVSSPRALRHTRTPRSSSASQGLQSSSAPGCSASSGMTRTATPMLDAARTTPAPRRSPSPRAGRGW